MNSIPAPTGSSKLRVWDSIVAGFGAYVTPGGNRSWFVDYTANGKRVRLTIRKVPSLTCSEARKIAAKVLRDAASGVDAKSEKIAQGEMVARDVTLRAYWEGLYLPVMEKRWKQNTINVQKSFWANHILPELGNKRISEISKAAITRLHAKISTRARTSANRCTRSLRAALNYAIDLGLIESNPATNVSENPERPRERFLSPQETQDLFAAIDLLESAYKRGAMPRKGTSGGRGGKGMTEDASRGICTRTAALFRLLLLTGARVSEIRECRWQWVDFNRRAIDLPDSKTGRKTIHLSSAALEELKRLYEIRRTDWVCESEITGKPVSQPKRAWARVREAAGLDKEVRIHDLRHSFASTALANGVSLAAVGKLLGHAKPSTTQRYAHLSTDHVSAAAEVVGQKLEELRKPSRANVVTLEDQSERGGVADE